MPMTAQQKKEATVYLSRKMFVEPKLTAIFTSDELGDSASAIYDHLEAEAATLNNMLNPNVKANATLAQKSTVVAIAAMIYGGAV